MQHLLGGAASPIGWSVQFIHADLDTTLGGVMELRRRNGFRTTVANGRPYPDVLGDLPPFEAPWTRELVIDCGDWTAYLNNGIGGGDASAIGLAVAADLGVHRVTAMHTPRHGPGHEATQLWVEGPGGSGPLRHLRNLAAVAEDGRWTWYDQGEPLPFEDVTRYQARRVRDRLPRSLLVEYLAAFGIPVDDDTYGSGVLVQQLVDWEPWQISLDEARAELG